MCLFMCYVSAVYALCRIHCVLLESHCLQSPSTLDAYWIKGEDDAETREVVK